MLLQRDKIFGELLPKRLSNLWVNLWTCVFKRNYMIGWDCDLNHLRAVFFCKQLFSFSQSLLCLKCTLGAIVLSYIDLLGNNSRFRHLSLLVQHCGQLFCPPSTRLQFRCQNCFRIRHFDDSRLPTRTSRRGATTSANDWRLQRLRRRSRRSGARTHCNKNLSHCDRDWTSPGGPATGRPGLTGCNLKFALRLSLRMACNIWAHPLVGLASSTTEACLLDGWISGSRRGPAARAGPGLRTPGPAACQAAGRTERLTAVGSGPGPLRVSPTVSTTRTRANSDSSRRWHWHVHHTVRAAASPRRLGLLGRGHDGQARASSPPAADSAKVSEIGGSGTECTGT